jgi:hypothetical protein
MNNNNKNTNNISGNPNATNYNRNKTNIRNKNKVTNFNSFDRVIPENPNNSLRKNNKNLIVTHESSEREKMLEMYILFSLARKGIMEDWPTPAFMTGLGQEVSKSLVKTRTANNMNANTNANTMRPSKRQKSNFKFNGPLTMTMGANPVTVGAS